MGTEKFRKRVMSGMERVPKEISHAFQFVGRADELGPQPVIEQGSVGECTNYY